MLEPLTTVVFNTLLSGRPFAAHSSASSSSALRMVTRSRHKIPQDFFTPRPRRVKGKERARPEDDACDPCTGTEGTIMRGMHSSSSDSGTGISLRQRPRRISGHKLMRTLSRGGTSFLGTPAQRRHSSNLPDASSSATPSEQQAWIDKINAFATWKNEAATWNGEFDYEDAWRAYEALDAANGCDLVPVEVFMQFASRIADGAQGLDFRSSLLDSMPLWGTRLQMLLHALAGRIRPHSGLHVRWRSLETRGLAMAGQYAEAAREARELAGTEMEQKSVTYVVEAYTTIVSLLRQMRHPVVAFEVLLGEWEAVQPFLQQRTMVWGDSILRLKISRFKEVVHSVVMGVENMAAYMLTAQKNWTPERQRSTDEFLIRTLCRVRLPHDALAMLDMALTQKVQVHLDVQLLVVKTLAKEDAFEQANKLFSSLSQWTTSALFFRKYQSLGLFLCAHQGDVVRSEEYFDRLAQRSWVSMADINMLMHAHAVRGDTDRVIELFHHFFPINVKDRPAPTLYHYTTVIFAHAQRSDFDGINTWLERMTEAGILPDMHVYSVVLHSFAMRGELKSMVELLDQMRESGLQPTRVLYTTIISLLATRKDPAAAEDVYKRALGEGIIPDRRMLTALMNAHVEAGQWSGVIRVFDYLASSATLGLRLTIEVFNTLLKAYVLIGAPFRVVAGLFQRLEQAKVKPDQYTFALLVQSACDSGLMGIATDLVAEMERLSESWETHFHLNVYVFTILMAGHLRQKHRARARAVYENMKARGIEPTAVTYSAIINAYAHEKSGEGLKIAEEFLHSLLSTDRDQRPWMKPAGRRQLPLEMVYAPIMVAHTWREDPEAVERLYREMLDNGGEPTLGTMTALFDAYRRKGDIQAVYRTWPQIVELGLRYSRVNGLFNGMADGARPNLRSQGTSMCIPLSIYLDALSASGRHSEIPQVWTSLREEGLSFDSHNWNHLAVALVRAGEPERAFEVIERVILPYRSKSRGLATSRDPHPESPLSTSLPPQEEEDDLPPAPSEAPMHFTRRRALAVYLARLKAKGLEDEGKKDFAHGLHVLHQISPLWNVWRAHAVTMRVLHGVLVHLEGGQLIQPYRPGVDSNEETAVDVQSLLSRRTAALEILDRIHANYPHTVRLLREYEIIRKASNRRQAAKRSM
ncbi:hypothetical protein BKA93DRAFT_730262 [Sparassis latifolia]